jgi:CHAT domain-containing protein/tetratricopeptide (TPR) repeat protein
MKPGILVASIVLVLPFLVSVPCAAAFQAAQTAQTTPPPPPPSPEAAEIDQLLKENRALLGQGKFEEVFPKADAALALAQKSQDKSRQARAIMQIAIAAFHLGEKEKALANFKLAVELAAQAGDHNLQSVSLNSAAMLLTSSGQYEEAFHFYLQSRALRQQLKDRRGEAFVMAAMTTLLVDTGNLNGAEAQLQEALQMMRQIKAEGQNDLGMEAFILLRIVWLELLRDRPAAAFNFIQQLLAQETAKTSGATRLDTRDRLGRIYARLGEYEKAAATYAETLALARQLKIADFEGLALGRLGWAQHRLGKSQEALPLVLQALTIARATGNRMAELEQLSALAEIQHALGRKEEALLSFRQAIKVNEYWRLQAMPTEEAKGNIIAKSERIYAGAIELLFALKRGEEALEIAEAWHARSFLDILTESRIDLRRELSRAQKTREDKLLENIARIQKELWAANLTKDREPTLRSELQTAEAALETFQLELRRANPRYASVKYPQPLKPERIAQDALDADTALIEFVLGERQSFAWVIQRGKIAAVTLPAEKDIVALLTAHRSVLTEKVSALTAAAATAKLNAISHQLYQTLLQPLEPHLTAARKLILVPDGALVYLPFETLVRDTAANRTEYLLERFALSYAPSASALAALKTTATQTSSKGVIAFGDPIYGEAQPVPASLALNPTRATALRNLPYTRREVSEIAALFPRAEQQTFLGAAAREQNVKTAPLDKYRYVHFAAHGLIDESHPARSGIALSSEANSPEDGVLQMSEVLRLKLNADLVTLSACRTGLGKLLNGEGMIGLTRAFLYAGADSVVVSLWNVNDAATAALMKAFYQNLQAGKAKDEALRQAKLTLLKGPQRAWRHPYYWASFVLVGEPH